MFSTKVSKDFWKSVKTNEFSAEHFLKHAFFDQNVGFFEENLSYQVLVLNISDPKLDFRIKKSFEMCEFSDEERNYSITNCDDYCEVTHTWQFSCAALSIKRKLNLFSLMIALVSDAQGQTIDDQ